MRLLGLLPVAVLAACQTYDFERVTPIFVGQTTDGYVIASRRLKPNVMLLVDRSLSMLRPIDADDPACPNGCGSSSQTACPAACPTRISELKSAMGLFFQSSGGIARFGVTQYPTNTVCQPADQINVRFPPLTAEDEGTEAALLAGAAAVNAFIQNITTMGGTPTGASLDFVGDYGELNASSMDRDDFRDDFVLLLTDGLPNCNDVNPNDLCTCSSGGNVCSAVQVASCACTSNCVGPLCALGCLDREGVVEKVKKLRAKGIRTIVVGFGADLLTGEGPEVLDAMAREGGFPRGCADGTDAECGGAPGSCNTATKQCATSFFQARNAAELSAALKAISDRIPGDGCTFTLSARPSDEKYLAVLVDGQSLTEGADTYEYDFGNNQVRFLGPTCARLEASTPQRPVQVEFRIVERF